MLIFDVYTDGEVRQNNGTYSYSYGIWWKCASKYIQKYWWLRSPITNISGVAWRVNRSGVVDDYGNNIHSSYGLISPGTENIDWGFRVLLDGDVRYINTLVINSYGKTLRTRVIPTTRGTWGQMVPSAFSTTMSAIPTEYYGRLLDKNYYLYPYKIGG